MPDCKIAACQISTSEFDEDKVWFNLQPLKNEISKQQKH